MKLQDIFEQLEYGELAHLATGNLSEKANQKKVLAQINLGLLELHKRFWLISKNLIIQFYENIYEYLIDSKYLVSNQISPEPYRYLIDNVYSPFLDDLLKIEAVYNTANEELPLNDEKEESSFFTPQYNILRVPVTYDQESVIIQYRANHPKLTLNCVNQNVELLLPPAFVEPLLLFIGHRISRILNSDTNQESNNYYQQFETACMLIKNHGYEVMPRRANVKLDNNGWV